ncbi:type II toxin-antitoxin system HicA family toxin [Dyadobacter aurulentus]|uniref:type II toxin-antitoxin system HicA family toxin n=1 Tax=Dyadobacter sp. UC 10 TaxID=2605428 RepID=UPI0011F3A9EE|nr:addiction module toxin, HicA family [Dyadobacter sp. UC 10]
MKSSEFHRTIRRNGWTHIRTRGSHYLYRKDGEIISVPYHGAKEMAEGIRLMFIKKMNLNTTL